MQRRLVSVILFALLAAFVSSTVLYKVISANSKRPAPVAQILVAAKDLAAGAVVGEADVHQTAWPSGATPQRILQRREDIVGRVLTAGINKDEPFAENRLAPKGAPAGLEARIPAGMRAVAVRVDELSGLSRVLMPGMRVDVLSTAGTGSGSSMVTRTILQNIEVLATGQSLERGAKESAVSIQSVNLLVTPEQAEVLSQAIAQNRIQLVLRNPEDTSTVAVAPAPAPVAAPVVRNPFMPAMPKLTAAFAPVLPALKPAAAEPVKPAGPTVEVIHGIKKVVTQVGKSETQDSAQ